MMGKEWNFILFNSHQTVEVDKNIPAGYQAGKEQQTKAWNGKQSASTRHLNSSCDREAVKPLSRR